MLITPFIICSDQMHDILIRAGIGRVYWIMSIESKRANARSIRMTAFGQKRPVRGNGIHPIGDVFGCFDGDRASFQL